MKPDATMNGEEIAVSMIKQKELSPCDKTDIIFSYFIENEIYDMTELDIQLEEHGQPCIIK